MLFYFHNMQIMKHFNSVLSNTDTWTPAMARVDTQTKTHINTKLYVQKLTYFLVDGRAAIHNANNDIIKLAKSVNK